jgi:hypothetical protein
MTESELLTSVGGVRIVNGITGDPAWNFGVVNPGQIVTESATAPSLYDMFPKLRGKWDGKTSISHHRAVEKVLGKFMPAHNQPKGTCGGRAGSRALEILQCILIAMGKRAKFKYVSHAWAYFLARREFNMLGGGDGVADGSIPPVLAKYGAIHRDECPDKSMAGAGSDDLAAKWGGGGLRGDELKEYEALAGDNIATVTAKIRSAEELADAIAAGGVAICSDDQGYSMTRDAEGICKPQGTWYHYHVRSGVRVTPSGRKAFDYDQSWGDTTPSGPPLPGCPGNCFGVDWNVQDKLCKSGSVHVAFGFDLWDLENDNINIDWLI